ncbi:FAD binding domain-containing protein [Atopobiaceae bacterium SGI.236]|nr:FAD binding domain-containing protein [Atopobiaceae bacterium]
MLRFERYETPETPQAAYELLQETRGATVIGGMMWLRLASRIAPMGIDLSRCGLDRIEHEGGEWRIGAMVTLERLSAHAGFAEATHGCFTQGVRDIVGAQFRNLATVGGSVYARMGFSDILTALLPLDCDVELVGAGRVGLAEFAAKGAPKDVLTHVVVRDHDYRARFESVRNSATDFSAVNACAALWDGRWRVAVGARPSRATLVGEGGVALPEHFSADELEALLASVAGVKFGDDRRASAAYRARVAPVLVRRAIEEALA